jgi:hypothetical protein
VSSLYGFLFVITLGWILSTEASPCCGASFLAPSIVTNDQHGHFLISSSISKEVQVVDQDGYWSKPSHPLTKQSFQFSSAYRWNTFQAGLTLPFLRNEVETSSSSILLADLGLSAGWTLWDHPMEIEKIIFFFQFQKPFGESKYSTKDMLQVSSQGLSSVAMGLFLIRTWGLLDTQSMILLRHPFSQSILVNEEQLLYQQENSYALLLGAGYSFGKMRLGLAIQPIYEGASQLGTDSTGSFQRHTDLSFYWNYFVSSQSSWTISYIDQTLIEAPLSSYLSRSIGISFRYAFAP